MLYSTVPGILKPISRLVQGTVMVSSRYEAESFKLLDEIFELGCTAFDTAHVYGGGDNERTVGKWITRSGIRDRVVLIGKGAHPYDGRNRCRPEDITSDIYDSIERFGFGHIDLYLLHRDDPDVPVGEIVACLTEHRREGRLGAFGGSNWTHQRIEEANAFAAGHGLERLVASSPQFGLAWPQKPVWDGCITIGGPKNEDARAWYARHDVALFPWSSLGGGIFSGRFRRDNLKSFEEYLDRLCAECFGHEENFKRFARARKLGHQLEATPAQIAMAWLMAQPMNVFALVGCKNSIEFAENAEALELVLTADQVRWLESGA